MGGASWRRPEKRPLRGSPPTALRQVRCATLNAHAERDEGAVAQADGRIDSFRRAPSAHTVQRKHVSRDRLRARCIAVCSGRLRDNRLSWRTRNITTPSHMSSAWLGSARLSLARVGSRAVCARNRSASATWNIRSPGGQVEAADYCAPCEKLRPAAAGCSLRLRAKRSRR